MADETNDEKPGAVVLSFDRSRRKTSAETPVAKAAIGDKYPQAKPSNATKYLVFSSFVDQGMVQLQALTKSPGMVLPDRLKEVDIILLNFSKKFGMTDFAYDTDGVRSTLSYAGKDYFTDVPWAAVYSMHNTVTGEVIFWPQEAPLMVSPQPAG